MRNFQNYRFLLWILLTLGSLFVFGVSVFVTFIMVDRPIHITCSSNDRVCSAYTLKLGSMFYHGMKAAKLEQTNPVASKKHAEKVQKHFKVPSKTFLVSDIQGYTCRKINFDAMSKYKSYIILKNKQKVILGQHQELSVCKKACQKVEQDIKNWNYSKDITLITE